MPVTSTMSPASAASTGTRSRPGNANTWPIFAFGGISPSAERTVQHGDFLARRDAAAADAADAEAADVARIVERADLELQRAVGIAHRRGNVRENRLEQRLHVGASAGGTCAFATLTSSVAQPFSADA